MAKTLDRIAAFLTNPSSKLKYYNDQEIETLTKKEMNKFLDQNIFKGRIIGLPGDAENASFVSTSNSSASSYITYVYVRLDDIDEYFLPDPIDSSATGMDTVDIILSHPVAIIPPEIATGGVPLGSKVECSFDESPGNMGKQRNLVVKKLTRSQDSDDYKNKLISKIGKGTLKTLADKFAETQTSILSARTNMNDFAGRYASAPAPVKRFLDDLVKLIKENKRDDLLPINVGSLYRSRRDQAQIMWNNVVKKYQADGINWFIDTYKPKFYRSAQKEAKVGTNYGFTGDPKNQDLGTKLRKTVQYYVKGILEKGIKKEVNETDGVATITAYYDSWYTMYKVLPSRHNAGEAVDIRTNASSRKECGGKTYSTADKKFLESLAKSSDFCIFAHVESLGKSGEHLHCSASPESKTGEGE